MLNLHAILFGRRTAFFADRPMKEHSVLRFFRALLKPFKLINYKLSHSISKKLEDAVASWISFIAASFVIIRCYPYKGLFDFLFTRPGARRQGQAASFLASGIHTEAGGFYSKGSRTVNVRSRQLFPPVSQYGKGEVRVEPQDTDTDEEGEDTRTYRKGICRYS